jgi:hypothetical protein
MAETDGSDARTCSADVAPAITDEQPGNAARQRRPGLRHPGPAGVTAAVITAGRKPRRRIADLLIAATAIAEVSMTPRSANAGTAAVHDQPR